MSVPITFAHVEALWLLLLILVVAVFLRVGGYLRRRALASLGQPHAVSGQLPRRSKARVFARLAMFLALILLVIGLAGPRWGKGDETGVVRGRDLVIVFDLSKSMLAEDMADPDARARWQAARKGLHELVDTVQRRGGHRLALVAFAARAWVLCPLSADYDLIRLRLDELDPNAPPPEVYPKPDEPFISGTRIGEGLRLAVAAHDPRFLGHQDILLVSDGDDPGGDYEWQKGVSAAATASIPVHVVGVGQPGDPKDPRDWTTVTVGDEFIQTRLVEEELRDIARLTHGEYYAARRDVPRLGEFFMSTIEPRASRDITEELLPQPSERYLVFLGPALLLMLGSWWLEGRR
jgi:Ca-activated chloride channel homolog